MNQIAQISGTAKLLRGATQGKLRMLATGEHEFTIFRQDDQVKSGIAIVRATEEGAVVKILAENVTVER